MKKSTLLAILFVIFSLQGKAQFVDFGQDPASLRWKQIKTDNFQIIYPDFFEENAQKIANIYAVLYKRANTLAHTPKKMSMIVHPKSGISNGSVAWAPKKSDLYTMPQQEPTDTWLEHLCVHEFRHIVQLDKIDQGFTKVLHILFGEQLPIAITGLFVPLWFIEGDAVVFESSISPLGRGRSPEFLNEMKAQVLEKGIYSYDKAVLGSYKDFVPNRYNLGYYMVGNARKNYGPEIWANAIDRVGKRTYELTPFRKSIKKTLQAHRNELWQDTTFRSTFINPDSIKTKNEYCDAKKTLYFDNLEELKHQWQKEVAQININYDTIAINDNTYTGYFYPTPQKNGRIIAFKKGFGQTGAFVYLQTGKEETITRTGIVYDYKFAANGHTIVWSEYKAHPRWEHGGRMTIVSYDMVNKQYRYHHSKYNRFSPFVVGEHWGIVEVDDQNKASLVILDKNMEKEIKRIKAREGELFIHPSCDEGAITSVIQDDAGIRIERIHLRDEKREILLHTVSYELDNPFVSGDNLYFRASFDGNNALYVKNLTSGNTNLLSASPFGSRFPTLNATQDSIYFSFYTADGYKPGKVSAVSTDTIGIRTSDYPLAHTLAQQEKGGLRFTTDSIYESRKYRKFPHLPNIHSWGTFYVNQYDDEVNPGIVVYSQNKLSTLIFAGGYIKTDTYDRGAWMFNATYKGWWPKFSVDIKSGNIKPGQYLTEHKIIENARTHEKDYVILYSNRFRYTEGEFSLQLPFNLSRKNYNRTLLPYLKYKMVTYSHYKINTIDKFTLASGQQKFLPAEKSDYDASIKSAIFSVMEYGLIFSNQTRMTAREIHPKWGQIIQMGYDHYPFKKLDMGSKWWDPGKQWWVSGQFYFPGFFNNHSFSVYVGYQKRPEINNRYDKKILSPRGISMYGYQMNSFRTNYKFPILYPDQHITWLAYIKSVKGGIFFDGVFQKARLRDPKTSNDYRANQDFYSYGVELTADCYFLRLPFPVNIGTRIGYETQTNSLFADYIFNVSFYF